VLDALFVAVFRWGLVGAAVATATAQYLGAAIPMIYFSRANKSLLRFCRFTFDGKALLRTCTNGSSELMSNLSMSLVGILYNLQLMRYAGENGIAAYGVIMYVNLFFLSVFIGFAIGSAPLIGFNYGAQNHQELQNLFRKSLVVIGVSALAMLGAAVVLAKPLSEVFVGYDQTLMDMTVRGFLIYSLSFLLCGFNIFGSSMFTALNNGLISAVISFVRTLICQTAAVMILPLFFELDGIWVSVVAAELAALVLTVIFLIVYRKRYHY
jgi:Na+-driven multidrug efflux pump